MVWICRKVVYAHTIKQSQNLHRSVVKNAITAITCWCNWIVYYRTLKLSAWFYYKHEVPLTGKHPCRDVFLNANYFLTGHHLHMYVYWQFVVNTFSNTLTPIRSLCDGSFDIYSQSRVKPFLNSRKFYIRLPNSSGIFFCNLWNLLRHLHSSLSDFDYFYTVQVRKSDTSL